MSNFRFELDRSGVRSLLQSEEMRKIVETKATEIAGRAGAGFSTNSMTGKNRVNAMVYPETPEAYFKNLKNNTLLKALK